MTQDSKKSYLRGTYEAISGAALKAAIIDRNVAPALVKYGRVTADAFVGTVNLEDSIFGKEASKNSAVNFLQNLIFSKKILTSATEEAKIPTQEMTNAYSLYAFSTKFATVGFGSYLIRASGPAFQNEYAAFVGEDHATQMPLRYYTGALGGYFRYSAMGKPHPEIGAVNNLLYEVCNHHKFCADNPLVNIPFTIATETADTLAQDFFKGKLTSAPDVIVSATNGAMTGIIIAFLVHLEYIPAITIKGVMDDYLFRALEADANTDLKVSGVCPSDQICPLAQD